MHSFSCGNRNPHTAKPHTSTLSPCAGLHGCEREVYFLSRWDFYRYVWESGSNLNMESSSAGGQSAIYLSNFSSEGTSSVKPGVLKFHYKNLDQKSTAPHGGEHKEAPHDSEHKSSSDELQLEDPVEDAPPARRAISHAHAVVWE